MYGVNSTHPGSFFGRIEKSNNGLPNDLLLKIFHCLSYSSLIFASQCSKKINRWVGEGSLWQTVCIRDFPKKTQAKIENWKHHYQICLGFGYLQIPFPGKVGIFFADPNKNWKVQYSGAPLREMHFVNNTKEALISEFSLLGYKDGSIALSVKFSKNPSYLKVYLLLIDPSRVLADSLFEPLFAEPSLHICDPDLIKIVFRVICHFHQLPNESALIGMMKEIIQSNAWDSITPLSESETQTIQNYAFKWTKLLSFDS